MPASATIVTTRLMAPATTLRTFATIAMRRRQRQPGEGVEEEGLERPLGQIPTSSITSAVAKMFTSDNGSRIFQHRSMTWS